ncbi:uncharacterized protein [Ptychodera flava]|uniref:uncharacterized protein n=1 Tax=Ptychodera flava TaxID=63121 RepID=UPI003969DA44
MAARTHPKREMFFHSLTSRYFLTTVILTIIAASSYLYFHSKAEKTILLFREHSVKHAANLNRVQDEVTKLYPWLIRPNCLPNYFTRTTNQAVGEHWPLDETYRYANCTIVFLHILKSGGTTTKMCFVESMHEVGRKKPKLIYAQNAAQLFISYLNGREEYVRSTYMGDHTFSICDFISGPCAYFTVIRDPLERVISSYNFCRTSDQTQCVMRNISQMTLNDWAVHQGSFFFRQLLANPEFFTDKYSDEIVDKLRGQGDPPSKLIAPWWRNKLILDHLMDDHQKEMVLAFVLDNLEKWFAVIGLTSEYDTSFHLFQQVFKLPFYTLCAGRQKNQKQYHYEDERQDFKMTKDEIVGSLKTKLSSDPDVMRALYFDIQIYKKAKDIFRKQALALSEEQL